jgi:uncharacterized repeat protein (TIGR01451 family)
MPSYLSIVRWALVLAALASSFAASAQTASITAFGTPVAQNFDTLANTGIANPQSGLPAGWSFIESGNGVRDDENYAADDGSSNVGDTMSYGAGGSTERALGQLRSGTLISTFGAAFTNNTGGVINTLSIAYTGEQWRLGSTGRLDKLDFEYSLDASDLGSGNWTAVDALDFTAPTTTGATGALDGNAATNRSVRSFSIVGLAIADGATFRIRWIDFDAVATGGGSAPDDGLAVDSFSLTAFNNSSQTNPSGVGAATPSALPAGQQTLLTVTVTPGTNPVSTDIEVRADLTAIGGSATQLMFDNGSNGDVTAGDNVFSFRALVPNGTSLGTKNLPAAISDAEARTGNATISLDVVAPPVADLSIAVTDAPDPVPVGSNLTYTITIGNAGPEAGLDLVATLPIPANSTFQSSSGSGSFSCNAPAGGIVVCNATTLAVSGSATLSLVVQPTSAAAGGSLSFQPTLTSAANDPVTTNNTATETTTVNGIADLSITAADNPDPVNAGALLNYTVTVANAGPTDATLVVATLPVPANASFESSTPPAGWTCLPPAAGNVICNTAAFANGASAQIGFVVRAGSAAAGNIVFTPSVSSAATDPATTNNNASTSTAVLARADLSISISDAPDPALAGGTVTYTVMVGNTGPDPATSVITTTLVLNPLRYESLAASGWTCTTPSPGQSGTVECSRADLPVGMQSFSVVGRIPVGTAPGTTVGMSGSVSSTVADPNSSNNSSSANTAVVAPADVAVTVSDAPDPVAVQGDITYTVTVNNAGPADAATLALTLPVPASTTFVSATAPAGWTCTTPMAGATGTATCDAATLANGASAVISFVVRTDMGTAGGTVNFTTNVAAATGDLVLSNNSASAITAILPPQDLILGDDFEDPPPPP